MKIAKDLKVALVHDDLVQWGGAEKVLYTISDLFPDAPIYTSVFDKNNKILSDKFSQKNIKTSFMQRIPFWRSFYKALLPIYPIAFEQFDFSGFDIVISQSTRFSKGIITKPETKHLSYCHTPPRFLWNFSGETQSSFLKLYFSFLRLYDRITSARVDLFLAGSENAKNRIKKVYQLDSKVLYPFVNTDFFNPDNSFDGGYYLIIARLNKYKRVDIAVDAFNHNKKKLKIIGSGEEFSRLINKADSNIEFLSGLSDDLVKNLIQGCKGLIITAEEDFGLTSLEAQACGKGVIAFGSGGAKETVIENETGVFFDQQTTESLLDAIEEYETKNFSPQKCRNNAESFSEGVFKKKLEKIVSDCV